MLEKKKAGKVFHCSCVSAVTVLLNLEEVQMSQVLCERGAGGDGVMCPGLLGLPC